MGIRVFKNPEQTRQRFAEAARKRFADNPEFKARFVEASHHRFKINPKICSVCGDKHHCKGLCKKHYAKEIYRKSKEQGLCPCCASPAAPNKVLCQKCDDAGKVYASKNKERRASGSLKNRYGITFEDKKRMHSEQNGLCALCNMPLDPNITRSHVDHDHVTNKVRALLHKRCNIMVGYLEDPLIGKAQEYLRRFSDGT